MRTPLVLRKDKQYPSFIAMKSWHTRHNFRSTPDNCSSVSILQGEDSARVTWENVPFYFLLFYHFSPTSQMFFFHLMPWCKFCAYTSILVPSSSSTTTDNGKNSRSLNSWNVMGWIRRNKYRLRDLLRLALTRRKMKFYFILAVNMSKSEKNGRYSNWNFCVMNLQG